MKTLLENEEPTPFHTIHTHYNFLLDYVFVDSIEDAVDWLSSKGFSVDKDGIHLHREKVAMKL